MVTPIAHFLLRQKTIPKGKRVKLIDGYCSERGRRLHLDELLHEMDDFHCFNITEIQPLVQEIRKKYISYDPSKIGEMCRGKVFLPAPKTWLECKNFKANGHIADIAIFLIENIEGAAKCIVVSRLKEEISAVLFLGQFSTETSAHIIDGRHIPKTDFVHIVLAAINTPNIVGRVVREAHRGLNKDLRKLEGAKKYPLHEWTEIKLHILKPPEIDDGEPHEGNITGRRALHFCRKHLRIRLGKLEYVSAHWRGDAAVGIRRARYKVVAHEETASSSPPSS